MQHHETDEVVKNEHMRCRVTAHYLPALSLLCSTESRCIKKKKRRRKRVSLAAKISQTSKAHIYQFSDSSVNVTLQKLHWFATTPSPKFLC